MCTNVKGETTPIEKDATTKYTWPCYPNVPPPPKISQSQILAVGFVVFLLASIWPPLILIVAVMISRFIPYTFRINDDAIMRRKLWHQRFLKMDHVPKEFACPSDDVMIEEHYWVNSRGMCLMTSILTPNDKEVIGVVCFCHGYMDNASFLKRLEYKRLVRAGFALVTIEYEGHGRSDGLNGYIASLDNVVKDTADFFYEITKERFPGKKRFLMGESMGGAICYQNYNRNPSRWNGIVFVAPMCKVSDNMLPPDWVINLLLRLMGPAGTETILGYLPLTPSKGDISLLSHRLDEKRQMAITVPFVYGRVPRLNTAREILLMTKRITSSISDFDAPFLVVHGKDDKVTCPKLSQALYDESKSKDKEIKLYEGMYHAITVGEPDDEIEKLFKDVLKWLKDRV